MNPKQDLRFEGFRLDRRNQELHHDSRVVALRPKTFAVLQYLAENPARLITQEELLKAVWGKIAVGDGLLRGYIRDLRHALGDDADSPKFIETIPRRGFRFLPKVAIESGAALAPQVIPSTALPASDLVGRDQDLGSLHRLINSALEGKRQVVFIAGEAGIGKTALLNTFLRQAGDGAAVQSVCGQCIEQYGTREAYLPIFDALSRLCTGDHASQAFPILSQYAPSWLAQMPGLLSNDQLQVLQKRALGTTQTRMLCEFCDALEAFAAEQPLIFALEDLQWTDLATLDLLSIIARREQRARLMVVGTYRPADVIVSEHPLRAVLHDLLAHRQCAELWPDYLTEAGVEAYLARRFPNHEFPANLKRVVHRNTAGNPLFVTAIVDELVRDNLIESREGRWHLTAGVEKLDAGKSASLRQLIEGQLSRLTAGEQRLLEAAAVVGSEFTSDLVAAALEIDPVEVEERCDALLGRRQVLRTATDSSSHRNRAHPRYGFIHDLYRAAAFNRSSHGRRSHWYRRIAEKIAADFADRVEEAATELAYYFEHAGMPLEAAHYCALAAEKATQQSAYSEAVNQFRRGIDLLQDVPSSNERDMLELRMQAGSAVPLVGLQGYGSKEVEVAVSRARELNEKLGEGPRSFQALHGLYEVLVARGELQESLALCDKLDRLAQREIDPHFTAVALRYRGVSTFFLGQLTASRDALIGAIQAGRQENLTSKLHLREDSRVAAASTLALVLWMLGYPEQALGWARDALERATALDSPFSIVVARSFRAMLMRFLRDHAATIEEAAAAMAIGDKFGFSYWRAQASLEYAWALMMRGDGATGLKELRSAVDKVALGSGGSVAKLAEAYLKMEKTADGLRAVDETLTLVTERKEAAWEPELHRLKGELLFRRAQGRASKRGADVDQAERCFSIAIERARANEAKSFELRAAMSLSKLWSQQGKRTEARRIVADVYGWFTEGLNTPDLVDARRLLDKRRA